MKSEISTHLDAILARADAAMKGPWYEVTADGSIGGIEDSSGRQVAQAAIVGGLRNSDRTRQRRLNAQFIAAARQDVPQLVKAVRKLMTLFDNPHQHWGTLKADLANILANKSETGEEKE